MVSDSAGPQVKPELLALLSRAPGDQMLMVPGPPLEKPQQEGQVQRMRNGVESGLWNSEVVLAGYALHPLTESKRSAGSLNRLNLQAG